MKRVLGTLAAAAALAVVAGCATASRQSAGPGGDHPTAEIGSLERALAAGPDRSAIPGLLLARGHAYLLEGESWLKAHPDRAERRREFERYGNYFVRAINDFETIVREHAESPAAPEAMFHLGIAYDFPNISNVGIALDYYRKTIERYPGTEWAGSARQSVANIEELMRRVKTGTHGM